jgi:hypothetical protein
MPSFVPVFEQAKVAAAGTSTWELVRGRSSKKRLHLRVSTPQLKPAIYSERCVVNAFKMRYHINDITKVWAGHRLFSVQ